MSSMNGTNPLDIASLYANTLGTGSAAQGLSAGQIKAPTDNVSAELAKLQALLGKTKSPSSGDSLTSWVNSLGAPAGGNSTPSSSGFGLVNSIGSATFDPNLLPAQQAKWKPFFDGIRQKVGDPKKFNQAMAQVLRGIQSGKVKAPPGAAEMIQTMLGVPVTPKTNGSSTVPATAQDIASSSSTAPGQQSLALVTLLKSLLEPNGADTKPQAFKVGPDRTLKIGRKNNMVVLTDESSNGKKAFRFRTSPEGQILVSAIGANGPNNELYPRQNKIPQK